MSSFDDLSSAIEKLGKQLYEQGRKTANLARLKMDLRALDLKRSDYQAKLGEKVFRMYSEGKIKDPQITEPIIDVIEQLLKIEVQIKDILHRLEEIVIDSENFKSGSENNPDDYSNETK